MRPLQQYCLLLLLVCYFVVVCLFVLVFYNDLRRGYSLRSRRLQVVGKRENGRARGRHARVRRLSLPSRVSFSRGRFFLCHYFGAPASVDMVS